MNAQSAIEAVMDCAGEMALLEAGRLAHAGDLATCAGTMDTRDAEALAALFRAIGAQIDAIGCWIETIRTEVTGTGSSASTTRSPDDIEPASRS